MHLSHLRLGLLVLIGFCLIQTALGQTKDMSDKQLIQELIERCYVHGAFNEINTDAMREGFHPDFAVFSINENQLQKYPIEKWAKRMEEVKNSPSFDPELNVWEHKFEIVDITVDAAMVKVLLYTKDRHIYTDYLSLLKFDEGWRIVGKVFHRFDYFKQE